MAYRWIACLIFIILGRGVSAETEAPSPANESFSLGEDPTSESQFYVRRPFIDLETLLESSDELRAQYVALSNEERQMLLEAFDKFNDDFQTAFHSLLELDLAE